MFFSLIAKHLKPLPIYEKFFQLVFVEDIPKAVLASFDNEDSNNKIYFLADPKPYSWLDFATIIAKTSGKKTLPLPLPDFVFYVIAWWAQLVSVFTRKPAVLNRQKAYELTRKFWLADANLAIKDLNFENTNIEIGVKKTYNWYFANKWLS
jgi:nucleoside-diphosphate-sugar epimerase